MAIKISTTLRNTDEPSFKEMLSMCDDADLREVLLFHAKYNIPVDIIGVATDGYYDIELLTGHQVEALSWFHLDGFKPKSIDDIAIR